MIGRIALVLLLFAIAAPHGASAQAGATNNTGASAQAGATNKTTAVISERPDKVTVTIYHEGTVDTAALAQGGGEGGLALITETRAINLPAGLSEIQFRGVASTMVPQTADVSGLPDGVLERNFDYDLLSPGALLKKSVGETVRLIRRAAWRSGTEVEKSARVLSGPDGVMLEVDGRFEALSCSGLAERLVFDHIPDGLRDTPTLTVRINAARAGHYILTLRYIAVNLNWSADYVARIAADDRTLDLSGWITLANFSDTGFSDAPVEVIAGHVETSGNDAAPETTPMVRGDSCWPMDINWATLARMYETLNGAPRAMLAAPAPPAAPMMDMVSVSAARKEIEARNLGDYKLYPLPEPTTVAARQTKQVQFLDRRAVPFERIYGYRMALSEAGPEQVLPASILLRLQNTQRDGLGKPLPAGGISAMAVAADGDPFLAGRDRMGDIAVGLPLEIAAGETIAVRAQARLAEHVTIVSGNGHKHSRDSLEVTLINDKSTPAAFEWRQAMEETGVTLVSESRRHGTKNGDLLWAMTLRPGARAELRYTIDTPQ